MTADQVQRRIDRATANVHKFFKSERAKERRAARGIIRDHVADAKHGGNVDGARRMQTMGRDLMETFK